MGRLRCDLFVESSTVLPDSSIAIASRVRSPSETEFDEAGKIVVHEQAQISRSEWDEMQKSNVFGMMSCCE